MVESQHLLALRYLSRRARRAAVWLFALLLGWIVVAAAAPTAAQSNAPIYTVDVDGVVTSVTVGYLQRAVRQAEASNAAALIIRLSNGGAVLRAIRPFAGELAAAQVPIVVYVAPEETRSGAAGTFFLSAAHIAAMAPDTSFGNPTPLAAVDSLLTEQTQNLLLDEVSQQLREWNAARGRNVDWIDRAVREGVLLTNEQAIAPTPPIINVVARDIDELLTLIEGQVVQLENGETRQLQTLGRDLTLIEPTLWEQFLFFLTDPTIAFMLLVMGAIALYAEIASPGGGILAGIGITLLLAALGGFLVLPISWLGLAAIILALGIVGMDLFVPSHGALTVIGLVLLVIGALNLIDATQAPGVFVALWAIVMVVLFAAVFTAVGIWLVIRTRSRPITTGQEGLIGRLAEVRGRLAPEGMVFVDGALWQAISEDGDIEAGEWVRITAAYDLRLIVRRVDNDGASALIHPRDAQ